MAIVNTQVISKHRGTTIYVTAQDRKKRTSKTITLRGENDLTPASVLEILAQSIGRKRRRAG